MTKYVRRPKVVEAMQFDPNPNSSATLILARLEGFVGETVHYFTQNGKAVVQLPGRKGRRWWWSFERGDWIVKTGDRFKVMDGELFAAMYVELDPEDEPEPTGEQIQVGVCVRAKTGHAAWYYCSEKCASVVQDQGYSRTPLYQHEVGLLHTCALCHKALIARPQVSPETKRTNLLTLISELSAVVRIQNGNLHADINELLARAESAIQKAGQQP